MHKGIIIGLMSLLALPGWAQTAGPLTGSTGTTPGVAPSVAPSVTPGAGAPAARPRRGHGHRTIQERFDAANTTRDGKLTLAQAQTGMPRIAQNFDAIDTAHKGYVTMDDIHAYNRARRAARRAQPH